MCNEATDLVSSEQRRLLASPIKVRIARLFESVLITLVWLLTNWASLRPIPGYLQIPPVLLWTGEFALVLGLIIISTSN